MEINREQISVSVNSVGGFKACGRLKNVVGGRLRHSFCSVYLSDIYGFAKRECKHNVHHRNDVETKDNFIFLERFLFQRRALK